MLRAYWACREACPQADWLIYECRAWRHILLPTTRLSPSSAVAGGIIFYGWRALIQPPSLRAAMDESYMQEAWIGGKANSPLANTRNR